MTRWQSVRQARLTRIALLSARPALVRTPADARELDRLEASEHQWCMRQNAMLDRTRAKLLRLEERLG